MGRDDAQQTTNSNTNSNVKCELDIILLSSQPQPLLSNHGEQQQACTCGVHSALLAGLYTSQCLCVCGVHRVLCRLRTTVFCFVHWLDLATENHSV